MDFLQARKLCLTFLLLLVAADLMFILADIAYSVSGRATERYRLDYDFGHAEVFQYVKFFWGGALLGFLFLRLRHFIYLGWALLFLYLLLDDAYKIHETLGGMISRSFDYPDMLGVRGQDFGELSVSAIAGTGFLVVLGLGFLMSDKVGRDFSVRLGLLFGVLVFFGVGIDMVHMAVSEFAMAEHVFRVIEDGGEMVAVSLMCWFTLVRVENLEPAEKLGKAPKHTSMGAARVPLTWERPRTHVR